MCHDRFPTQNSESFTLNVLTNVAHPTQLHLTTPSYLGLMCCTLIRSVGGGTIHVRVCALDFITVASLPYSPSSGSFPPVFFEADRSGAKSIAKHLGGMVFPRTFIAECQRKRTVRSPDSSNVDQRGDMATEAAPAVSEVGGERDANLHHCLLFGTIQPIYLFGACFGNPFLHALFPRLTFISNASSVQSSRFQDQHLELVASPVHSAVGKEYLQLQDCE
ncbi:hypothetical protein B0H19DRAFT_1077134 [Mycena capillaripes]|nr:hypothetical protein B0H19DRAFT_1077134 [Mycena capillaripes]